MVDNLTVRIITPQDIVCECISTTVTIPAEMGEIQVYRGHIPLLSRLRKGTISIISSSTGPKNFAVEEGFFEVTPEEVNILPDAIVG